MNKTEGYNPFKGNAAPNASAILVMVADDSGIYRDGLANILAMQHDLHVAGLPDTPAAAAEQIRKIHPDIVLLGWPASSVGSQRVFAAILESKLSTRVIMLSDEQAREDCIEAVRQGCCGIVPKRTSTELLLKSIR